MAGGSWTLITPSGSAVPAPRMQHSLDTETVDGHHILHLVGGVSTYHFLLIKEEYAFRIRLLCRARRLPFAKVCLEPDSNA